MKIKFDPFLQAARGKMGDTVFRLCHTGEWQITKRPDMSRVRWSQAQEMHRERMAEAYAYASTAMEVPEVRAFYLQLAWEKKRNKRPYDMAVSDFYHNRINRMGPDVIFWNAEAWREEIKLRRKRDKRRHGKR